MRSILAIAKYTIIEQIRNRLYLIILFFGALMLVSAVILGVLAPGHKVRVIFDVGLITLELFGLATAIFGAVSLVLQEVESKTIYLILTRPLPRSHYILGRYLGLVVAVTLTMSVMALFHILLLVTDYSLFKEFTENLSFWAVYPVLVVMSMAKMWVTATVALFFSLFATSAVSALVFTAFFWIAGHFGTEITYLIRESSQGMGQKMLLFLAVFLPNFQYFNFRDSYAIPGFPGFEFIGWALLYGIGYGTFFLIFSTFLFSKKEF